MERSSTNYKQTAFSTDSRPKSSVNTSTAAENFASGTSPENATAADDDDMSTFRSGSAPGSRGRTRALPPCPSVTWRTGSFRRAAGLWGQVWSESQENVAGALPALHHAGRRRWWREHGLHSPRRLKRGLAQQLWYPGRVLLQDGHEPLSARWSGHVARVTATRLFVPLRRCPWQRSGRHGGGRHVQVRLAPIVCAGGGERRVQGRKWQKSQGEVYPQKRNSDRKRNRKVSSARAALAKSGKRHLPARRTSGRLCTRQWRMRRTSTWAFRYPNRVSRARGIAKKAKRGKPQRGKDIAQSSNFSFDDFNLLPSDDDKRKSDKENRDRHGDGLTTGTWPLTSKNRRQRTTAIVPTGARRTTITTSPAEG